MATDTSDWEPITNTPPASDWEPIPQAPQPRFKIQPPIGSFQPSQFSSGVPFGTNPALNPDWDLTRSLPDLAGKGLAYAGNVARAIPADVAAGMRADPSVSGNIPAAIKGESLPVDEQLRLAAGESPTAATVGKISQGLAASAPLLLTGGLPSVAQRLVALGFSADMLSKAPQLATDLGTELGKPPEQRDQDKLTGLVSDAIQTGLFAPLAGAHGLRKGTAEALPIEQPVGDKTTPTQPIPNETVAPNPSQVVEPTIAPEAKSTVAPVGDISSPTEPVTLQPAIKYDGKILTGGGKTHTDILMSHGPDFDPNDELGLMQAREEGKTESGFVDPKNPNVFLTREEANKTGIFKDNVAQSENLPDFQNGEIPPKNVTPIENENQKIKNQSALVESPSNANDVAPAGESNKIENQKISDFDRYKELTSSLKGKTMDEAQPVLKEIEQIKNRNGGNPPIALESPAPAAAEATKNAPEPALGESKAPVQSPVPEGGSGGVYGIAQRVREQRSEAGQVGEVPIGEGTSAPDSVEHGRELLGSGIDPEKTLFDFESTNRFNANDVAVVRAHGEQLAKTAHDAETKFGRNSDEYKSAFKALTDWDTRSKKIQTEWSESGRAQQGATDIDTGSFTGLQRAKKAITGKDFTPKEAEKANAIVSEVTKANKEADAATKALYDALDKETAKQTPVEPHIKIIADRISKYFDTRAQAALKRLAGKTFSYEAALPDLIDLGVSTILKGAADFTSWSAKMLTGLDKSIEPHLKDLYDKSNSALDQHINKEKTTPQAKAKVRKVAVENGVKSASEAEKKAVATANKTVREAADRLAKAESDARVNQAGKNKQASQVQIENARKAVAAADKTVREAAARAAEAENKARIAAAQSKLEVGTLKHVQTEFFRYKGGKMDAEQVAALWNYAKKQYLEKGTENFNDIRHKVATDLGLKVDDVTRGLAQPKGVKKLADDAYIKAQKSRRLQEQAKQFVMQQEKAPLARVIPAAARYMFGAKVFGHGMVAFGTHAPVVAFQPKYWASYVKDYGKMAKMVVNRAYYERQSQDLMRKPNYVVAKRAGLVNDPYKVEDFNNPKIAQYFGPLSGAGNRGYFALKLLRQDMFDQAWNKLPSSAQVPEIAEAISDGINHATGVVKAGSNSRASLALFAPKLLASRAAWLVADPAKAVTTFSNWKNASPAEKMFAINQVKEKATVAATLFGLLAANQAILSATDSKQKINFTDPFKGDFLKFKGAGMNFSYGNAMLSMARLPVQLYKIRSSDGGKLKNLIYPDEDTYTVLGKYARSQLSPLASLLTTLMLKADYENRPLPSSNRPVPKRLRAQGIKPYTWPEFWTEQFLPIPAEEAVREVWRNGLGMTPEQTKGMRKAMATIAIMSLTGGRMTEDIPYKK